MKSISCCLLLVLSCIAHAQNLQYGIVYPSKTSTEEFCCTYFPNEGYLQLYDTPNGEPDGKLLRRAKDRFGYEDFYTLMTIDNTNDTTVVGFRGNFRDCGFQLDTKT